VPSSGHDNGRGLDAADIGEGGLGLVNLRRRAEKLHGQFATELPETGGTSLIWQVPSVRNDVCEGWTIDDDLMECHG
jgi:nitrate/nitrite-specific signal transduction histidine kinase